MRTVIQRVKEASCWIEGKEHSKIENGLVVLLGIEGEDLKEDAEWLMNKITDLRIFPDDKGHMNCSLVDVGGELLIISQFTLHASVKKGKRPSFIKAARPEIAEPLYQYFIKISDQKIEKASMTGVFGADMEIKLINDGPVTIIIDTKNKDL